MENLAMKELERGREFANQLRRLMFRSEEEADEGLTTSSAEDLVAKVVDSFTNTLSLFTNNNSSHLSLLHHQVSADSSSSCCHFPDHSDESHDQSFKSRSPTTTIKDPKRSSPKKRKSTHTWEEDSKMSPKEDGHAWRKYGQKIILNAKYPRNYFRCTHKYDQGCQATKQVQRIQDDPPLYKTTYFGHHTCTNLLNPQIIIDSPDLNSTSSCILSFDNNNNNNNNITTFDQKVKPSFLTQQSHLFLSSSSSLFPSGDPVKQEKINDNTGLRPSCSSNDCQLVYPDYDDEVQLPFDSEYNYQVDVFTSAGFRDLLEFDDYDSIDAHLIPSYFESCLQLDKR
ncbi:probable WRKY transcription factor 70 [Prosopis cineraria]|uniref:probable WRKY transcription factor 70 n=1 Tax=Prosopis cineraria TaxID=364024 RepID=UPI0024103E16|nr:probable WRKY transcription factor 70 [Prosopis cineraria]